jgi:hypothetical protein
MPYYLMSNKEAAEYVLAGNRLTIPPGTHPQLADLMSRCWLLDPLERPTFVQVSSIVFSNLFIAFDMYTYIQYITRSP